MKEAADSYSCIYGEDTNAKGTRMTRIKRIFISAKQKNL